MRSWRRPAALAWAMLAALAPALVIVTALIAAMLLTHNADFVIMVGAVVTLIVFWLLRRSARVGLAVRRPADRCQSTATGPDALQHDSLVNGVRSGAAVGTRRGLR